MRKRITIELDEVEAAAFEMLLADCAMLDPAVSDASLAHDMVLAVLEDDLAAHRSELGRAH